MDNGITMKRIIIAVLLLILAVTAQAQVKPFVKAGVGTSEYWLENAEGTNTRFSYAVSAGVDIPFKDSRFGLCFLPRIITIESPNSSLNMNLNNVLLKLRAKHQIDALLSIKMSTFANELRLREYLAL